MSGRESNFVAMIVMLTTVSSFSTTVDGRNDDVTRTLDYFDGSDGSRGHLVFTGMSASTRGMTHVTF
jgi:hypothetical protein